MRIRRLHLKGFGCLRGEFHFAADRVNLVLEPNERGKSTLAAAILAGLYGLPSGQRRSEARPIPEPEIYRPWRGEDYLLEMDFEAAGRVFTVRRDFAGREERVFEWRTGKDITSEFQAGRDALELGSALTGLDREDFARTVMLRQSDVRGLRDASGLTAALQRMATSQQGDVAAAEAIEILRAAARQYRGRKVRRGKIETEIAEIQEEIAILSDRLLAMESRRHEAERRILELERVAGEEGRIDSALHRLEYLVIAAGRREDAARLAEEERDRKELEAREAEFQALASYADFPAEGLGRLQELKGRLTALAQEEDRLRARASEEIDAPLAELEARGKASEPFSALDVADLSRFSAAEADLAAAWRARRDARRSLRLQAARWRRAGLDPDKVRRRMERLGALGPDDRRFLLSCGEQEVRALAAISELEKEVERAASGLDEADQRAGRSRALMASLAGIAAAAGASAVMIFFFTGAPKSWAYGAAAAAAAALVACLAVRPGGQEILRMASLEAEEDALRRSLEVRRQEADAVSARLESLARSADCATGAELLAEFREMGSHQEEAAAQAASSRQAGQAAGALRAASGTISSIMQKASHRPRFGAVTPRTARAFRMLAASHRETLSGAEALRERRRAIERQISALDEEREAIRIEARSILEAAALPPADDLEGAVVRAEEALGRKDRHETLRREVIPALVRRSMTHQGDSLRRAVEVADAVLRRKVQETPALADLAPQKSHKEYVEERDRLRQESRSLAERRLQLSAEMGEVLREYRKEYPDTQRWLAEWRELLDRAESFKASIDLACEALEEISREAYAEWAEILNERATEALAVLAPGYGDFRFDEDLSFTLREAADGSRRTREDVDHRFSAGARDQVYLAARLAVADYLSAGRVRLPLVLDDPFASFDDSRFDAAMELLVDKLARRHQIILLSCHETRHRAWQERHPHRFAERVRVMSLQAPTT